MAIELTTPGPDELGEVVSALRSWQHDAAPLQLHPGDLGWAWRYGAEDVAAAVRTWTRDGLIVAIGFLDGDDLLRMTVAPEVWGDDELAHQMVTDLSAPERGVLPAGEVSVEAPSGARVHVLLSELGWSTGEAWTPLRRDLTEKVDEADIRVELVHPENVSAFTAVIRSAFDSTRFTDERWQEMTTGLLFADARCLLAFDRTGGPVAGLSVWAAGEGRPGLIEPMGVHIDHRGRGYGRAICLAGAAELRRMGSSSAVVCTPSSLTGATATYRAAGFEPQPERFDRSRDA
jgi:ribosomal protein S18 acetylase RimI-like enzyme